MDIGQIELQSREEIQVIIQRAIDEHWQELAIIGPHGDVVSNFWQSWQNAGHDRYFYASKQNLEILDLQPLKHALDLRCLYLPSHSLTSGICNTLTSLRQLESLILPHNKIDASGAQEIAKLTKLTSLDLDGNKIGEHGAMAIARLDQLVSLKLWRNAIGDQGTLALASLCQLRTLNLQGNNIGDQGVVGLASLHELNSLNLSINPIGARSLSIISNLDKLTSLRVSSKRLDGTSLKPITQLQNLHDLNLHACPIGDAGANHLAQLANLKSLELYDNQIGDNGACALAGLTRLTLLHLPRNHVGDQGAIAIAELQELSSLDLRGNKIGNDGAQAIASMHKLVHLDLSGNHLGLAGTQSVLDAWLKRADTLALKTLKLDHRKPCSDLLPPGVLEETNAIKLLAVYRQFQASNRWPFHEAKLAILGAEGSGKTSLIRQLVEAQPCLADEQSTPGIARHEHIHLNGWDNGAPWLNIWEFGGRQNLQAAHRYFLSSGSLYLLVVDSTDTELEFLHLWLRCLDRFDQSSPIIIVLTKCDLAQANVHLDAKILKHLHRNIIGIHPVSCIDSDQARASIAELNEAILQALDRDDLYHIHAPLPSAWHQLRNEIACSIAQKGFLKIEEFREMCVYPGDNVARTEGIQLQNALLSLLHKTGRIIAHEEEADWGEPIIPNHIFDNNWLTNAVYGLLSAPSIASNHGVFSKDDLANLWDTRLYPNQHHDILLRVLGAFEMSVCSLLGGTGDQFLIPDALPNERPDLEPWPDNPVIIDMDCTNMPCFVLPQMITMLNNGKRQTSRHWRLGFVLDDQAMPDCRALVRTYQHGRIEIHVSGPKDQHAKFLHPLRFSIAMIGLLWGIRLVW